MKRFFIYCLAVLILTGLTGQPGKASDWVIKQISKAEAPFFVSIWSIQEPENSRSQYLCDAVIIDRNFAVGSASCLDQNKWPLVGVVGSTNREDRGSVFPIWTWTWTTEFESDPKKHDLALIYAPHGIAPWAYEYNQQMPLINYSTTAKLEMISWALVKGKYKLQSMPMKISGKLPSKSGTKPIDNVFKATSIKTSTRKNPYNCQSSPGTPLVSRESGRTTLVGIAIGATNNCDPTKPLEFILVDKFKNFIDRNKLDLTNDLVSGRKGVALTPLYNSILSPKSQVLIPVTISDNGSTSSIVAGNDPDIAEGDISSIGFNIWKSGWNEVVIGIRDELDACAFAKNATFHVQVSKSSAQNVDYSFQVKEGKDCWTAGKNYYYAESKNSKIDNSVSCTVLVIPAGKNFSNDPLSRIKYLRFNFNPACLGVRESIWIRAALTHGTDNATTDVEPFNDGWFGPWKPTIF
jgi:hypothetical protein